MPPQDACQELDHFGLGCKRDRLLCNGHVHQFLDQSVLLQKFTECHQQSVIGIAEWPVRSRGHAGVASTLEAKPCVKSLQNYNGFIESGSRAVPTIKRVNKIRYTLGSVTILRSESRDAQAIATAPIPSRRKDYPPSKTI